jgi:hypothetical protein
MLQKKCNVCITAMKHIGQRCIKVLVGKLEERTALEHTGIDEKILKWIFKKCVRQLHWIDLAQDRDK